MEKKEEDDENETRKKAHLMISNDVISQIAVGQKKPREKEKMREMKLVKKELN